MVPARLRQARGRSSPHAGDAVVSDTDRRLVRRRLTRHRVAQPEELNAADEEAPRAEQNAAPRGGRDADRRDHVSVQGVSAPSDLVARIPVQGADEAHRCLDPDDVHRHELPGLRGDVRVRGAVAETPARRRWAGHPDPRCRRSRKPDDRRGVTGVYRRGHRRGNGQRLEPLRLSDDRPEGLGCDWLRSARARRASTPAACGIDEQPAFCASLLEHLAVGAQDERFELCDVPSPIGRPARRVTSVSTAPQSRPCPRRIVIDQLR